jgi:RNA polymerase-binding transcription factor DksA
MTSDRDTDAVRRALMAEQARLSGLAAGVAEDVSGGPVTEGVGFSADSETGPLGELADADQHPADTGAETFNRERDLGILESIDAELSDVEAALAKLEAGTYGSCEACGQPIGEDRLAALPAARFCIEDAERAAAEAAPGVAPGLDGGPPRSGSSGGSDLRSPESAL